MGTFASPVRDFMTTPAVSVSPGTSLQDAYAVMQRHDITALAVVEQDTSTLIGVLSRADLVHRARLGTLRGRKAQLLRLPAEEVAQVMSDSPLGVTPDRPLSDAARMMDKHRIHRVFVVSDGALVGVLSTFDLMRAVHAHGVTLPIGELSTRGLVRIDAAEPVSLALQRIEASHVHGIAVTDRGWPVGVFTQGDALAAQHATPDTRVGDVMNPAVLVLPEEIPLHRAAAQASAMRARRIIVTNGHAPSGIVSGLDFARAVR